MSKLERIIIYPLCLITFIVVCFFDFQISASLFDPSNAFGQVFEMVGELFFQLLFCFSSFYCFLNRNSERKKSSIIYGVLFFLSILISCLYGGGQIRSYVNGIFFLDLNYGYIVLFALPYAILTLPFAFISSKWSLDKEKLFNVCLCVIILYLATWICMNLFKVFWFRPRYRFLAKIYVGEEIEAHWLPFYQPQGWWSFSKYAIDIEKVNASVKFDDCFSFPSGHTMNSLGIICLSYFPLIYIDKKKRILIKLFSYLWGLLVALSRIYRGAHNATDVVFGYFLGVFLFDLVFSKLFVLLDKKESFKEKQA